jgi:DUF4097 and DUF4098 domain-containing protein YvlB
MDRLDIKVSGQPRIIVENASGDLRIKGWNRQEVRADADGKKSLTHEQDGNTIKLKCHRDCYIRVPGDTNLEIKNVAGEALVKSVDGNININYVGGNLSLKDISGASVDEVGANLSARGIGGDLSVSKVGGNADVRDIDGEAKLATVGGNINVRGEVLGLEAEAGGNASLRLDPDPDGTYEVKAGGEIHCRLSEDASAKINVHSNAGSIKVKAPDFSGVISEKDYEFSLAEGESKIELKAGGNVYFKTYSEVSGTEMGFDYEFVDDFAGLAEDITDQVASQIEGQMEALNDHLNNLKLGSVMAGSSRARATAKRAEQKLESAQRRLERRAAAAQRRAERKFRKAHKYKIPGRFISFAKSFETRDPVGDDERLMVLEMVQEGKISVEEAESLLAVMEGQSPEIAFPPEMPEIPEIPEKPEMPEILTASEEPPTPAVPKKKAKPKKTAKKKKDTKKVTKK